MCRMSIFYPNVYGSQNTRLEIFNNNSNVRSACRSFKIIIVLFLRNTNCILLSDKIT